MSTKSKVSGVLALFLLLPSYNGPASASATEIECIPLKWCPMALDLIHRRPYDPDTIKFLRYSHCGFDHKEPKVWCNKFEPCLTPDSRNGTCTEIHQCRPYLNLLRTLDLGDSVVRKYLREFRCNTEFDNEIRVCCADEKKSVHGSRDFDDRNKVLVKSDPPQQQQPECGRQLNDDKIFGGTTTMLDEYPWMALLKYTNKRETQYGCGGVLIGASYVLTAAHCVDSTITRQKGVGNIYSVVLGEYDVRNETDCFYYAFGQDCADPPQELLVDDVIIHPDFNASGMINDIALVRLQGKVTYTDYIQPICLPSSTTSLHGNETFTISGWGRTPTSRRSAVKMKASVKFTTKQVCNRYNKRRPLTDGQICAGEGKGTDSCFGDSGGPLMLREVLDKSFVTSVMGIVSYGFGRMCGAFPGVYTYVPAYVDWINSNIK